MDNFVQNMAEAQGFTRDPISGAISKPMPGMGGPLVPTGIPGAKVISDPNILALMQALQGQADKRKKNHWPDSGAPVIHPTSGQVLTSTSAVRD